MSYRASQPVSILTPSSHALLQHDTANMSTTRSSSGDEFFLKIFMIALFLPEGLSFFIGDFRLSVERVLVFVLSIIAISRMTRRLKSNQLVSIPSDTIALIAGIWMMLAATLTDGFAGLKGSGIEALEFVGTYYIFRYMLGSLDSSVRIARFSCKLVVIVAAIALLDPLNDKLFTYELIKSITGYVKPSYEAALAVHAEALYRDGAIRAMGPLEHSILLGAVCVWFGTLALKTFPRELFGWSIAVVALIGTLFSQARGPLLGYIIAFALLAYNLATPGFTARWNLAGLIAGVVLVTIFTFSGSPFATLVRLGGISAESGWYRQAIWDTALPVVLQSPLFGIGLSDNWNWQVHGGLVSASVDAFWLKAAMMYGIPGSTLILLTVVSAFWKGSVARSPVLSREEQRLSEALGIVITTAIFLGFIVHYWGTCWILLGAFAGMRANLAEAAILRKVKLHKTEEMRDNLARSPLRGRPSFAR